MGLKVIIYGATGMLGGGVLIECFEEPEIESVLVIGRRSCGVQNSKLQEIIIEDFLNYDAIEDQIRGYDACFFCLGVSSVGISAEEYYKITYTYTEKAATILSTLNPEMVFCYISGYGTDEIEKSHSRWARVKGKTENMIRNLPFKDAYLFRPAYIQPVKGVKPSYAMYKIFGWLYPLLKRLFPSGVTNTEEVGKAMINAVRFGLEKKILKSSEIIQLACMKKQ